MGKGWKGGEENQFGTFFSVSWEVMKVKIDITVEGNLDIKISSPQESNIWAETPYKEPVSVLCWLSQHVAWTGHAV